MTIARAQMYRQLYQLGGSPTGIATMPMDFGQSLQVNNQGQGQAPLMSEAPNYSSATSITTNPLLNYGQPQLGQAGGTPLTMRSGGISRLGYQEGGMGMMEDQAMMQPQMQDQAMMQPQMQQPPLEGIMGAMPQDAGMMQEGGQEQTALLTIIQLLIEQGVPPEQAQELAMQILQVFNQGGAPAVEEFANQLEQEEGMPENRTMMAGGGITGIYPRQGYFFKGVVKAVSGAVKGVAKAVKSVAKSPIGQIALAIAAPYAIGAMFPTFATLGGTGFMGAALRAGISNLAIQGITTGKFNPKQALMAAVGGGVAQGVFGPAGGDMSINPDVGGIPDALQAGPTFNPTLQSSLNNSLTGNDYSQLTGSVQKMYDPGMIASTPQSIASNQMASNFANLQGNTLQQLGELTPQQNIFERGIASLKTAGTDLMNNPIETIGKYATSAYDTVKENALPLATGFLAGSSLAQQPNESDDEYASRAARDPEVQKYITLYGGGIKLYSPEFYKATGAVDPFAGRSTFVANGGRIGYAEGSTSFEKQTLEKKGYGDMMKNMTPREISQLYDSVMGTFSRRFQAEGTMPMGEPRKNPAGIMELDYRAKGGFVPPVGIKEKADDIPAMLSNNEFVFTADAVRNAGGGNVNKGAQRMYGLMKQLESGGRV